MRCRVVGAPVRSGRSFRKLSNVTLPETGPIMKRPVWGIALLVAAAACGGDHDNVVVRATLGPGGSQPVAGLPVRLLPYDRRAILDSLAQESGDSMPAFPQGAMERLRTLQAEAARVKPRGDTAVARVEAQRRAYLAQLDGIRKAREKWLADRRDDFEKAVKDRTSTPEKADTTDVAGRASFSVDEGNWWVVSSYVLPDAVLEWQRRVTLPKKGDSTVVNLTRQRAREEPFF
jgi:hypothetical protein